MKGEREKKKGQRGKIRERREGERHGSRAKRRVGLGWVGLTCAQPA